MKGDIEILRALRQPPMGKLVVQTGTGRFTSLDDVENAELRRRILAAIGDLLIFAGGYDTLVDAGFAPPLAPPLAPAATAQESDADQTLTPQQAAFISQLEMKRDEVRSSLEANQAPPEPRPSLLGRLVGGAPRSEPPIEPASPAKPLSLPEQINNILQSQIADDPDLAGRGIQLTQATGRLQILVDGRSYSAPTEIEDVQVRQAIKRALKTWETGSSES